ncbi:hypothetical protein [Streptomyces sp. A30]|uniref:hypothetical protein n=1 Tax=Streptomyces sp. A30 TaxID=2789273 RepID=UPI00397F9746
MTEYGTCAYRGAGQTGGMARQVPPGAVPDEEEQLRYLTELVDIFEEEGVDTPLWFTFAGYSRPGHHDLGSYGVVRMLDETRRERKKVFHTRWRPGTNAGEGSRTHRLLQQDGEATHHGGTGVLLGSDVVHVAQVDHLDIPCAAPHCLVAVSALTGRAVHPSRITGCRRGRGRFR